MYRRILVPLEHSAYDDAILAHVCELARLCASSVVLIHVADGWAARNQQGLALRESAEMRDDLEYIEARRDVLEGAGIPAVCVGGGG
jgi:nucleotide-binding universal stress UspA family protein